MRRESYSNRFATALDGRRHRQPGHGARPQRASQPGAARRRARSARRHAVQVRDVEFLQGAHEPPIKITVPGPVHDVPAGAERLLRRAGELALAYAAPSATRSSTCSRPAPTSSRSTSRTCRRGPSRRASTGSTSLHARARRHRRHDRRAHLLRLRGDHPRAARAATRSCPSSPAHRADQISIETGAVGPRPRVLDSLPGKTIILGVLDLATTRSRRPRRSPTGSAARSRTRPDG